MWQPEVQIWSDVSIFDVKNHASRCAYEPQGCRMFLIAISPDCLYVCQNTKRFWRLKANVCCPLPLVCQGAAAERSNGLTIFLTDCLRLGHETFEHKDLDLRLHKIWFVVLRRISGIENTARAHLAFRAVGRATQAVEILKAALNMFALKGFHCEGVSFIARHSPPGRSIFVPTKPTLKLAVSVNTYFRALLYATADDGGGTVPFRTLDVNRGLHDMHGRVVRFEIRAKELVPVSICKYDLPDHISYVRAVTHLMMRDFDPGRVIVRCQEEVKAQAKQQDPKHKQRKG
jgi:hypothetical protein